MNYSTSKQLINNTKHFLKIKHYNFISKLLNKKGTFYGWGRKKSGLKAIELAKRHNTNYVVPHEKQTNQPNYGTLEAI